MKITGLSFRATLAAPPCLCHVSSVSLLPTSENDLNNRKSFLESCHYDVDNEGYKTAS